MMHNQTVIEIPEYLSPSSASTYESCPKKWKLKYIEKLDDPSGQSALIGTFVHLVLEHLCQKQPGDRTIENAKSLARQLWKEFTEDEDYKLLNLNENDARLFRWEAWRATEGLWKIEDPSSVDVVSTEQKVITDLDGIPFKGIIDRVDKIDDQLIVSDYKSGKLPGSRWHHDKIQQILLYAAALQNIYKQTPARARLLYLNQRILDIKVDESKLDSAKQELSETWSKVQLSCRTNKFDAKPSVLCGWCSFFETCTQGKKELTKRFNNGKLQSNSPATQYFLQIEESKAA